MNLASETRELASRIGIRDAVVLTVPEPKAGERPVRRNRHQARRAVISFMLALIAMTGGLNYALYGPCAAWRDPEYAARRDRLLERQREFKHRPTILVLGSSRTVEGVRPEVVNGQTGPLLLNGGLVGSGSMLELMSYRRLKAAGLKPTGVLLEYWPPLLRGDNHAEYGRIDLPRLEPGDLKMVRDYYPDPPSVTRFVYEAQLWPAWRYRRQILASIRPKWVPDARHDHRFSSGIDRWGWWPGCRDEDADAERAKRADIGKNPFRPYLVDYSVGREADRALRDLLAECRADGVAVALIVMPEGPKFRTLYTADAEQKFRDHLNAISNTYQLPVFNARERDEFSIDLPDDVHLTQGGAARLTRLLATELPRLFPTLYGKTTASVVP
ncbi:MAG: hypothetical protein U0798_03970 [Gemmataceae bacterium]